MSEAFVVVKPDLANFATELRTQLKTAIGQIKVGERTILVRAQFEKGTRDKLIASLGTKPIPVFVEPVLAPNSLAALRAQIKSLGALPVDVGTRAGKGGAAATPPVKSGQAAAQAEVGSTAAGATPEVTTLAQANAAAAATANEAAAAILREAAAFEELQARGAKVGPAKFASLKGQALAASNERLAAEQAAKTASQTATTVGESEQAAQLARDTQALEVNAAAVDLLAAANAAAAVPIDKLTLLIRKQEVAARSLALAKAESAAQPTIAKAEAGLATATQNVAAERERIAKAEAAAEAATDKQRVKSREAAAAAEKALAKEVADFRTAEAARVAKAEEAIAAASVSRGGIAGAGARSVTPLAATGAQLKAAQTSVTAAETAIKAASDSGVIALRELAIAEKAAADAALVQAKAADTAAVGTARQSSSVARLAQLERTLAVAQAPGGNTRREQAAIAASAANRLSKQAAAATLEFSAAESFASQETRKRILAIEKLSVSLAAETKSELANAIAAEKTAAAQAKAAQTTATRTSQAGRAVGATSATFLGLRGAVLSSSAPFLAATVAVIAFAKTISTASSLQQNLNVFQSVAGASADQMARVSENAKALGADLALPATSANDAAEAMTELAKAGLSVNQTIDASRGVLQLATAANISVGDAATITASQLNAFGLAGSEASRVADLLAGASISAQGEITDFALAFQQVATVAKQVDLSINTTTAILTEFAKAGLRSSDAGTSLRTLLLRLVPTSKSAAEAQRLLGVQIDRNIPIGQQFFDLIDQFRLGLAKLDPIAQQETLTKIFGQDAIRGASIAFSEGSTSLRKLQDEVSQAGLAAQVTEGRTKGLAGAIAGLKSQIETLAGTLGTSMLPALESITKQLSSIAGDANTAANALQKLGNVTVKPIASALGGADNLTGAALFAAAGLGIRKLLDRRRVSIAKNAAAAVAASTTEVAAETAVTTKIRQRIVVQSLVNGAYANNAKSALASSAIQVSALGRVQAASIRVADKLTGILAGNKAIVAAAAVTAAGAAIESQTGDTGTLAETGSIVSKIGQFAIGGAFLGGAPGAIAAGTAAFVLSAIDVGKKSISDTRAVFDALDWQEQQLALADLRSRPGGELVIRLYGLKPKSPTEGQLAEAASTLDLVTFSPPKFGPGFSLPSRGGQDIFVDPFAKFFANRKKFVIKGIAEEKVDKRLQAKLALAIAEASGDSAGVEAATRRLIAVDKKQIAAIEKSLAVFTLAGFNITGEARKKLEEKLIELYGDVASQNQALEQAIGKAAEFTIPASVTVAGINAGTTKTLTDDLAQKQTIAGLTAKALQNQLSKKKKDQDTIDDLSIKLAQANADVTNTTQQIADQNVANAQSQLQIAADAAGNIGAAENKYIAFLRAEANDASKTTAEQIAAQKALTDEIDKRKNALQGIIDASKSLRDARTDLLAQIAASTTGIKDDVRIKNLQIRQDRKDIKDIKDQVVREKLKGEELKKAQTQIVKIKSDIFAKQQEIKKLQEGDSGGFSLNDLFKEAISQFNQFGSNVASGTVSTGGSVRGALAGGILAQKNDLTKADRDKLQVAGDTNNLLSQILDAIRVAGLPDGTHTGRTFVGGILHGQPTAKQARSFARLHAR